MNILLIAATPFEITPFTNNHRDSNSIDIAITGVGMLATAYHLTKKIAQKKFDMVIQAGIAGSFNDAIQPGDVVTVNEEFVADMGVTESGGYKDLFDMNLQNPDEFPFTSRSLKNNNKAVHNILNIPKVTGVTVNQITSSKSTIDLYKKKYGAEIESMEGAALHYICLREKIPFIQLRSISNYVGERNKSNWKIKEAISNLNEALMKLCQDIQCAVCCKK